MIGTLLGTRSEDGSEVEVRNCFAVGHTETQDQVEVDMEYQKSMLALHLKANPKEVLIGWYATSSELNTFSALIQNFYGGQGDGTFPHPAVHLTVSTSPGSEIEARAYISAPVGVTAERAADSAAFIPVPCEIRYGEAEKSGLEVISSAKDTEERSANVLTDVESLERSIEEVLSMLERVSKYVEAVIDEEVPGSSALGQFLLNTLALAPKVDPEDIERDLYVVVPYRWGIDGLILEQQQPHPGRPRRILPRQYHPHADRSLESLGYGSTYPWRNNRRHRAGKWQQRRRTENRRAARWWQGRSGNT